MNKIIKDKPLVSIIINCFNGEKYLKKSIESILNQKYKNWEIIFWDNFSQDKSKEIFFSFKDKRLKYLKSKNFLKLYEARNRAIKKSRGDYICFLDVDDWWSRKKLYKQVKFIRKNKDVSIIYSNYYIYNQKFHFKKKLFPYYLPSGNITQKLLDNYCIGILTVMIKRNIFNSISFNPRYNILGDFDFFVKASKTYKIYCIQEPLCYYRFHGSNYSLIKTSEYINELTFWLKKISLDKNYKTFSFKMIRLLKFRMIIKRFIGKFINLN